MIHRKADKWIDFLLEKDTEIVPLEVKSGKDYTLIWIIERDAN